MIIKATSVRTMADVFTKVKEKIEKDKNAKAETTKHLNFIRKA